MTHRLSAATAVTTVLRAQSVAIIGASDDGRKPSGRTLRYLGRYGFAGRIYPVNPHRDTVQGFPAVARIADIPEPCDLAVIFASGYSETGPEGGELERSLVATADAAGVRLIGPNCVGVVIGGTNLTATFMTGLDQSRFSLRDDGIAFVSQSGAMGAFILNLAQSAGIGLGRFFSVGNEADLSLSDIVDGLIAEGSTRVIAGYVEGITDGPAFAAALARAQWHGIPVCLIKVGASERGAAAAASHTGALAGADRVYGSVFDRYGVQRADSVEQLLDFTRMLSAPRQPLGSRMTIVTLSGGAGALMTDYADELGIDVFPWSQEWRARLDAVLPSFASTANPVDVTGAIAADLDLLSDAVRIGLENPDTDVLMIVLGNLEAEEDEICARIGQISVSTDKPIVVTWVGGSGRPSALLADIGVPVFSDPARGMRAVAAAIRWNASTPPEPEAQDEKSRANHGILADDTFDEVGGKRLLASAGVPTVREEAVDDVEGAVRAAAALGYPVVVKLLSAEVAHKSDIGGVRLGLGDDNAVRAAATDILDVARRLKIGDARLVVQAAVDAVHEVILGMATDPTFGPVIAVGMGGIFTEVLGDVQLGVAPVDRAEARRMLDRLRGIGVLRGSRGGVAVNEDELVDVIVAFSRLAVDLGDRVESIEINPLLIDRNGHPLAVDALVIPRTDAPTGSGTSALSEMGVHG
ncbi:MAG TPA: acetate--CoA ligase family protein [Pseudolysinimonas sp.]|nr:acetate--CoA ligase family protein [Pseudolysinimonas sp.]